MSCPVCQNGELISYISPKEEKTGKETIVGNKEVVTVATSSAIAIIVPFKKAKFCPECGEKLKIRLKNKGECL